MAETRFSVDALAVERVDCKTCGATDPLRCTTTSGRNTKPHRARVDLYLARTLRPTSARGDSPAPGGAE